jgi:hypothetical protein
VVAEGLEVLMAPGALSGWSAPGAWSTRAVVGLIARAGRAPRLDAVVGPSSDDRGGRASKPLHSRRVLIHLLRFLHLSMSEPRHGRGGSWLS